jgi:hypothetical protein
VRRLDLGLDSFGAAAHARRGPEIAIESFGLHGAIAPKSTPVTTARSASPCARREVA